METPLIEKMKYIGATRNLSEACNDRKFKFKFARSTRRSCARGHHLLLHAAPAQLISLAAVIGAALPVAVSWAKDRKSHLLAAPRLLACCQ